MTRRLEGCAAVALVAALWLAASGRALAQAACSDAGSGACSGACSGFGCAGQIALSGSAGGMVELVQQVPPDDDELAVDGSLWVSPVVSYFVADQLELFTSLKLESQWRQSRFGLDAQAYGFGLGAGVYLPFASSLGLLVRASLVGSIERQEELGVIAGAGTLVLAKRAVTERALDAVLDVPLIVQLTSHVYAGAGLSLSFEVASSDAFYEHGSTVLGTIGTWW